jgi:hypothetical protein
MTLPSSYGIYSIMTTREQKLVDLLQENPKLSQTEAYLQVFPTNNRNAARAQAAKALAKPSVQIYKSTWVNKAKKRIHELSTGARSEDVSLRASQDILDREFGKSRQQVDLHTTSVSLSIDLTGTGTPSEE